MTREIAIRSGVAADAPAVHALVCDTGVLDPNSPYAYAATLEHFGDTCAVAWCDGRLAGFVTGYRLPRRPDTLFVWQVGVRDAFRGRGLATSMLLWLLNAPQHAGVRFLETTVTPSNAASRLLFTRLAARLEADCSIRPGFPASLLGPGHEEEELFRIGPIPRTTP